MSWHSFYWNESCKTLSKCPLHRRDTYMALNPSWISKSILKFGSRNIFLWLNKAKFLLKFTLCKGFIPKKFKSFALNKHLTKVGDNHIYFASKVGTGINTYE